MKKFSSVSGDKIGVEPKVENVVNEKDVFKMKIIKLMEDILSIRTHGSVDRYYQAGSIEITGKELLSEAILSLFNDNSIKDKVKLLESLKSDIRDWKSIDDKIDTLNESVEGKLYKKKFKVKQLLERYDDKELLVGVLERKFNKMSIETMDEYLTILIENKIEPEIFAKVKTIYKNRFEEINKQ